MKTFSERFPESTIAQSFASVPPRIVSENGSHNSTRDFQVVFMNSASERHTLFFSSEDELVAYMKLTQKTYAPISFRYRDGSTIDKTTFDRIHHRFFDGHR